MNATTPATNSRTGFAFGQIEQKSPLAGAAAALTEAVIVPPPAAWAAAKVRTFAAISIANCFESKGIVFSSIPNMPSKTAPLVKHLRILPAQATNRSNVLGIRYLSG